jgi:hypothetical protein
VTLITVLIGLLVSGLLKTGFGASRGVWSKKG